jgi:hypothetical protein
MDELVQLQSLDTAFTNLAALIRHLRSSGFVGRLHVTLDQYDADVFLYPDGEPSVWETDHASGRSGQADGALERLIVRSREPGGTIELFKPAGTISKTGSVEVPETDLTPELPPETTDWTKLLRGTSELFAAVERAAIGANKDFLRPLFGVRVELGDDYPFIDPTQGDFEYLAGEIRLTKRPTESVFVKGLSECLRRVVNKIAAGANETAVRERIAVELAIAMRRERDAMAPFVPCLDRIAGTRVV